MSDLLWYWAPLAQWLFNAGITIYIIWERHRYRDIAKFEKACEKIEMNEKSIIEIRGEMRNLPTQTQFDVLSQDIRNLTGALENTKGRLEGINRAVDLINEFLIQQGAKS